MALSQGDIKKLQLFWRALLGNLLAGWLVGAWYMLASGDSLQFGQMLVSMALGGWCGGGQQPAL